MTAIIALVLLTLLLVKSHANISASVITDCVGKVYGTSGCPLFQSSSSSVPATCGNSMVDGQEECDTGRFNGVTDCSTSCTFLKCGDGVVSAQVEEECEPTVQIVYALNEQTQQLTTQKNYTQNSCGVACTVPTCIGGSCTGGCKRKFLPACMSSTPSSISSDAASQAAMNAFSASSAGATSSVSTEELLVSSAISSDVSSSVDSSESTVLSENARCGNGIIENSEQCDDGAANADLADFLCRTDCTLARCGDAIIDGSRGERCDDGNGNANVAGALCRTNCALARCGDGIIDPSEECDDGIQNGLSGGLCSATCKSLKPVTRLEPASSFSSVETFASSESSESFADESSDSSMPVATTTFEHQMPNNIPYAVGIAGLCFLLFLAIIMRNDLRVLVTKATGTIDDIPLDDIEMPK